MLKRGNICITDCEFQYFFYGLSGSQRNSSILKKNNPVLKAQAQERGELIVCQIVEFIRLHAT